MPNIRAATTMPALATALIMIACAKSDDHFPSKVVASVASSAAKPSWPSNVGEGVPKFWVRPGFRVTLEAEGFGEARFMEFDNAGNLFVSQPTLGKIQTFRLKDGKYTQFATFLEGKRSVHGLCWANGWLWFTESGSVWKARDTNGDGKADEVVNVLDGLPRGGHWWRSILVTEDGFFTSIGDSGNATDETASDRQKIWKYSLDGKSRKMFVSGIRNTEKLRYRPGTTELYGADHGSDWFGAPLGDKEGRQPITDLNPPCEFNHYVEGGFYGHPFIVGNRVPRIEFQKRPDILDLAEKSISPAWCFGAHWAPNGWTFLTKPTMGKDLVGDALVALHGSWNRKEKAGYRIERVLFDKVTGEPFGGQMLVGTLNENSDVLGRPVDVAEAPDGTILFSDDATGKIYRISTVTE